MSKVVKKTVTPAKTVIKSKTANVKPHKNEVTAIEIKEYFTKNPADLKQMLADNPALADTIIQKVSVKTAIITYSVDPFDRFEKKSITALGLEASEIPFEEGFTVKFILDRESVNIAQQQSVLTKTAIPELYRQAIWQYFQTLSQPKIVKQVAL